MAKSIEFEFLVAQREDGANVNRFSWKTKKNQWRHELRSLMSLIKLWHLRRKQRKQLSALPDFMLKDLGISRVDAQQEVDKPFWKA